jgi:hypothetical protein
MCKGIILSVLFLFCVSASFSQDAGQSQLLLQETNLWLKVEYSLQSTQNEIDGLKNLVETLETEWQQDSAKLTGELMLSRADYSKLQLLQENTANSFYQLSAAYNQLKAKNEFLHKVVQILSRVLGGWLALKLLRIILGFAWKPINKLIPRWLDVVI